MILSSGHPLVRRRRHVRGVRTSVSQAATVSVQTKRYFCAERWGGRSSEGGSWIGPSVEFPAVEFVADEFVELDMVVAAWGRGFRGGEERDKEGYIL